MKVINAATVGMCFALAACSAAQPFLDSRREAGTTEVMGQSRPDAPVVCYNAWATSAGKVAAIAEDECARSGKHAELVGQDKWSCRAMVPHRARYRCIP